LTPLADKAVLNSVTENRIMGNAAGGLEVNPRTPKVSEGSMQAVRRRRHVTTWDKVALAVTAQATVQPYGRRRARRANEEEGRWMTATIGDYIDAARKRQGLRSDSALSLKMKRSQQAISSWRTGKSHPSDAEMQQLAQLAGADESQALVLLNVWRAKDERTRDNFRRLLEFFGPEGESLSQLSLP
jgi:ribosome-binding protein aMBF1 (putative translation factor)